MKKFILAVALVLAAVTTKAGIVELDAKQSVSLTNILKSSGAEEALDGRSSTFTASDVSCTIERMLGTSCVLRIKNKVSKNIVEQELNEKQSQALYALLEGAGLEAKMDGRTSTLEAAEIDCSQERFLARSCVITSLGEKMSQVRRECINASGVEREQCFGEYDRLLGVMQRNMLNDIKKIDGQ